MRGLLSMIFLRDKYSNRDFQIEKFAEAQPGILTNALASSLRI